MKKRILPLFLALVLLCGLLPASAPTARAAAAADWANEIALLDRVEADLVAAIRAGKTGVNMTGYGLTEKDIPLLSELKYYSPYLCEGIDFSCWYNFTGAVTKLEITYADKLTQAEINAYYARLEAKLAEMDAMLAAVPDDVDKVLVLHDWLVYNSEYDFSLEITADSFNTAGILMNGRGVCQGYAYAFMYLMNRAGVECHPVKSTPMNHTWDVVRIGNDYYHVDPTWDDPTPDVPGMVGHKFVLLSDAAVAEKRSIGGNKPHYGWDPLPVSCDSTKYDNAYWYGVDSRIIFSGGDRYYCKNGAIVKNSLTRGGETELLPVGEWPVWNEDLQFYTEYFTGLWFHGGRLYYNSATELRSLDPETMEDKAVYVPDTSAGYVYGSAVFGDKMCYEIKQSPNERGARFEIPLETIGAHMHSYTAVVTPPTCTERGFTTHICACGDSYADSYVDALGHSFTGGVCTRCGAKDPNPPAPVSFSDVRQSDWYYNAVNYAVSRELMNGVGGGRFAPNDPMTRAMLVTVLWRYEGSPQEGRNGFDDVPDGRWYTQAVAWAAEKGIVGGVGNGKFAPDGNITREQMAAILFRYANRKGFDTGKSGDLSGFPDAAKVSGYARDPMKWAVAEGIIGGSDGKLDPQGNATRAQVSTILMRFIENFVKTQAK